MGIFKNKSQATFDNMSPNDTSKGVVGGLIFCNQTNDTLVWKYPYMDIKKRCSNKGASESKSCFV